MRRTIFDEDHDAFRESCRRFVDRTLRPHHEKHIAGHEFGREVWLELGKQGFLGLNIPAEYGGAGVDDLRFSLILAEELSRLAFSYPSCVGIHTNCIAPYLVDLCTEEQKQRWLPGFCTGELITALAMTEASGGSDLAALKTRAVRDGEDWILNGSKTFITNGPAPTSCWSRPERVRRRVRRASPYLRSRPACLASNVGGSWTRSVNRSQTSPSCSSVMSEFQRRT